MKIAFLVGGFPRVSETFILLQIAGLIDRGHEVDIYTRRGTDGSPHQPEVEQYQLLSRTYCFDLPSTRFRRAVRSTAALPGLLRQHRAAVARCLNVRRYGSVYAVLNNLMFLRTFAERQYDVLFCHFGGNGIDFIGLKEAFPESRFVTMFHGGDLNIGDEEGPDVFDVLRELGDCFLVTTDCHGRSTLQRYGFSENKIVTHRLGIPVREIPFRERSMKSSTVRILTVGRLTPSKGVDIGIRAVAALQRANPGLRFEYNVVGDGPLRSELRALVRELNAEPFITLRGAVPAPAVMEWMRGSDIYVLPSRMEGGGVVLLEAQASGLPIVASRVGGVPEMVCDNLSALLVPPEEAAGFTGALEYLLSHSDTWGAMGKAGRRHVEERHDIEQLNDRLERILRG